MRSRRVPEPTPPYSQFLVGAAVRAGDGRVFTGANVENASYGLSICAERSAVVSAINTGVREALCHRRVHRALATGRSCGMCRQTLAEFASDCPVVLCGPHGLSGEVRVMRLRELLPHAFVPATLHAFTENLGSQSDTQPVPKTDAHDDSAGR